MRYKKPPPTFLIDEKDIETIDYNKKDADINDVSLNKNAKITAKKLLTNTKKWDVKEKKEEPPRSGVPSKKLLLQLKR